jgi:hypothetical protein
MLQPVVKGLFGANRSHSAAGWIDFSHSPGFDDEGLFQRKWRKDERYFGCALNH